MTKKLTTRLITLFACAVPALLNPGLLHAKTPANSLRLSFKSPGATTYSSAPNIPYYDVVPLPEDFVPLAVNDDYRVVGRQDNLFLKTIYKGIERDLKVEYGRPLGANMNENGSIVGRYVYGGGKEKFLFWMDPEDDYFEQDLSSFHHYTHSVYNNVSWNDNGQLLYWTQCTTGNVWERPLKIEHKVRLYDSNTDTDTVITSMLYGIDENRKNTWIGLDMVPRDLNNYGEHIGEFHDLEAYLDDPFEPRVFVRDREYTAMNFTDELEFLPHQLNDFGTIVGKSFDAMPNLMIRDEFGTRTIAREVADLRDNYPLMSNPDDGFEEIILGSTYWRRNVERDRYGRPTGQPAPDFWQGTIEDIAKFPLGWHNIKATCISANGVIAGTANYRLAHERFSRQRGWYLTTTAMLPDWNRDGKIDRLDRRLNVGQKWRFWLNDDDDKGEEATSYSNDLPESDNPDCDNDVVDGLRDLVDFFPVFLDLRRNITGLDLSKVKIRLIHESNALRFVYTSLTPQNVHRARTSIIEAGCGPNLDLPLAQAPTHLIPSHGIDLSPAFVKSIRDNGGILLMEGIAATSSPLQLQLIYNDYSVSRTMLELALSPVSEMMRIINLRNADEKFADADPGPWDTRLENPPGLPDHWLQSNSSKNSTPTLVHVHGFNWGEDEAPAAHAELFKRFFQSGSPARFVGVTWYSDQGTIDLFDTAFDYNENVVNALLTAPLLANALSPFQEEPLAIFGHSLGTMLAVSSVVDHSLPAEHLFLVNAAIPAESINGRPINSRLMVHPLWKSTGNNLIEYDPRLHASNWADLFPSTDHRSRLQWKDAFAKLPDLCSVTNFFSSGEDVLRPGNGDLPSLIKEIWHHEEVWVYNEMVKGTSTLATTLTGDRHGGWGFNRHYMDWVDPGGPAHPPAGQWQPKPVIEANLLSDEQLRAEPFFFKFSSGDIDFPAWGNGDWLYSAQSRANTHLPGPDDPLNRGSLLNHAKVLAEAIPAQSAALGATRVTDIPLLQNFDLDREFRNPDLWPHRDDLGKAQRWLHSDYLNPALPFVHRLYDTCIKTLITLNP